MARNNQIAELISRFLGSRGAGQGIGSLLGGDLPYARKPAAYQMKPDVVREPMNMGNMPDFATTKPLPVDYSSPMYPGGAPSRPIPMPKPVSVDYGDYSMPGLDFGNYSMPSLDSGTYGMPGFDPGADVFSNVMGKYPVASGGFDAAPAMAQQLAQPQAAPDYSAAESLIARMFGGR